MTQTQLSIVFNFVMFIMLALHVVHGKQATIRGATPARKLQPSAEIPVPGIRLEYRESYPEQSAGTVMFDDGNVLRRKLEEFPNLRVTKVTIQAGTRVDAVALSYNDGSVIRHGGDGGDVSELTLNENEYIVSVVIWIGRPGRGAQIPFNGVYGIQFTTNEGRSVGGGTRPTDHNSKIRASILTSSPYTISATQDSVSPALLGFFGVTGSAGRILGNEIHRIGGIFSVTSCPASNMIALDTGMYVDGYDKLSNVTDIQTPVWIENFESGRRLVVSAPSSLKAVSSDEINVDDSAAWQLTAAECPSVGSVCGTQCYIISSSNNNDGTNNVLYAEYTGDLSDWARGVGVIVSEGTTDEEQEETEALWQFVPQLCGGDDDNDETECFYIVNAYNGRRLFAQASPRTDFGASPDGTYVPYDDQLWTVNVAAMP